MRIMSNLKNLSSFTLKSPFTVLNVRLKIEVNNNLTSLHFIILLFAPLVQGQYNSFLISIQGHCYLAHTRLVHFDLEDFFYACKCTYVEIEMAIEAATIINIAVVPTTKVFS